ncbi:hypothetical protein IQ07DRAFT_244449 [Pyrenochaeta sp. DS3sAY3a]|nr:hypothetical protein IQ07DRAFT_244449 [Pyrenochaeta sp. DS3sAY3a]
MSAACMDRRILLGTVDGDSTRGGCRVSSETTPAATAGGQGAHVIASRIQPMPAGFALGRGWLSNAPAHARPGQQRPAEASRGATSGHGASTWSARRRRCAESGGQRPKATQRACWAGRGLAAGAGERHGS